MDTRIRLYLLLISVGLLPLGIMILIAYSQISLNSQNKSIENIQTSMAVISELIEKELNINQEQFNFWVGMKDFQIAKKSITPFLKGKLTKNTELVRLWYTTQESEVVHGKDLGFSPLLFSELESNGASHELIFFQERFWLRLFAPARDQKSIAYIEVIYSFEKIHEFIHNLRISMMGGVHGIALLDDQGTVVVESHPSTWNRRGLNFIEEITKFRDSKEHTLNFQETSIQIFLGNRNVKWPLLIGADNYYLEQSAKRLLLISFVMFVGVGIVLFYSVYRVSDKVMTPLQQLAAVGRQIVSREPIDKIEPSSLAELDSLANSFNTIMGMVGKTHEDSEMNRQRMKTILGHLDIGIVIFNSDLRVGNLASFYLEILFDRKLDEIIDKDIVDLIFRDSELSNNRVTQIREVLRACANSDELGWDMNSHSLPDRIEVTINGHVRHWSLKWGLFLGLKEEIDSFYLIIDDLTEEISMRDTFKEEKRAQVENLVRARGLANISIDQTRFFLSQTAAGLDECRDIAENSGSSAHLCYWLHILRANLLVLNLGDLASMVFDLERKLLPKGGIGFSDLEVQEIFLLVDSSLAEINRNFDKILGLSRKNSIISLQENMIMIVDYLKKSLSLGDCTLSKITCVDGVIGWSTEGFSVVTNIVILALENSVRHGYLRDGLRPKGAQIEVNAKIEKGTVSITIADDGAGLVSHESISGADGGADIIHLIFEDGTTSDAGPDASSLGIGLGVIRMLASSLKGSVELKNNAGDGMLMIVRFPVISVCELDFFRVLRL